MTHKFKEKTLVIASHNAGKVREIAELLEPYDIDVINGGEFNLEEPEENGSTFIENSLIKSRYFAKATGLPSLADDSGIVIPALDGAPGIYSARWGGAEKDFNLAMSKVEEELKKKGVSPEGAEAHFVCALSLVWPDGAEESFEGKVFGNLTFPPRGDTGFGYDPIFIPKGYDITFAEMNPSEKQKISHRANAFKMLISSCFL